MSENWQVGDLARAVGVERTDFPNGYFPEGFTASGKVYRVASVNFMSGVVGLRFDDFPAPVSHGHWHSASFRKIHPDKHEQCEPEFVTLIKRAKIAASGTPTRRAETSSGSVGEADGGSVPERQTPND